MMEDEMAEGLPGRNYYQNILRRYANVLNDDRERRMLGDGRSAPRQNQPQISADEMNHFISDLLQTVEQDIPQPVIPEGEVSQDAEEEQEEEDDSEEAEDSNQSGRPNDGQGTNNAGQEVPISPDQIASLLQSMTASLRLGQSQNQEGTQNQNSQANADETVQIQPPPQTGDQIQHQIPAEIRPQSENEEQKEAQPQNLEEAKEERGLDTAASQNQEEAKVQETHTEPVNLPEERKEQSETNQLREQEDTSAFNLGEYGLDNTFLENCGIDMTVFDMLPDEEKLELVMQLIEQSTQDAGNPALINDNVNTNNLNTGQLASNQSASNNQANADGRNPEEAKGEDQPSTIEQNNSNNEPNDPLQPVNTGVNDQPSDQQNSGATNINANNQQQQQQGNAQQQNNMLGIDPEILANLDQFPEDLRMDILQQQNQLLQQNIFGGNQINAPGMGLGMDMDVATFLETLDPSLRQEILATSDQNFIDALPSHMAAEAQIIRDNRLNRYEADGLHAQRNDSSESPLNIIEKTINKDKKDDTLERQKREKLFESDEKLIESLLKLLYLEPSKFSNFPFGILTTLSQHPKNEFRIFDTLMFLLKSASYKEKDVENQEVQSTAEAFPPRILYEKNRIIKDKEVIYRQVSPQMLFILHCLTQTKSDYFVQDRPADDDLEAPPSLQRNESLGSIKNLKAEMQIRENHPLYDLLQLCSRESIIHNTANVEILASIIENICKNPKIFKVIAEEDEEEKKPEDDKKEGNEEEEKKETSNPPATEQKKKTDRKKQEKEEIYLCKYKLDEQSVMSFCKLLYSENLSNIVISRLSFIIGVFCQEKHNLDLFIKVMKEILYKVSLESNKFLKEKLAELKSLNVDVIEAHNEEMQNNIKSLLNEIVAKFGNQVLILRIAKIIKFLYENTVKYLKIKHKNNTSKTKDSQYSLKDELFVKAREEIMKSLETIMLDDNLKAFWINVSECVYIINERLSKSWDVQNILNVNVRPIIESFFIIHKILNDEEYAEYTKAQTKSDTKTVVGDVVPNEEIDLEELMQPPSLGRGFSEMRNKKLEPNEVFAFICEKNKRVINNMIKQDFNLLNDSMSMIAKKVPKILDFEIRRAYFRKELSKMQKPGSIRLRVARNRLMENSFNQMYSRNADELRRKIHIEFIGEEGMDAGGVSREWFLELSRQVFNANYNLFIPSANGNTFQPSPISDPENLNYFKFVGKFIAKVSRNIILINIHRHFLIGSYLNATLLDHSTSIF